MKSGNVAIPTSGYHFRIWNPAAIVNWSVIFTPILGSWLQMLNWETLCEPRRAAASKKWIYSTFIFLAYIAFCISFIHEPGTIQLGILNCSPLLYLAFWYFGSGRVQVKYVKQKYGYRFTRRPWTKVLLVSTGFYLLIFIISFVLGIISEVGNIAQSQYRMLHLEAMSLYDQGKYHEGQLIAQAALEIAKKDLGPDHTDVAILMSDLAGFYQYQEEYEKAEQLCKEAQKILEKNLSPDDPRVSIGLNNLEMLYQLQDHYEKAEQGSAEAQNDLGVAYYHGQGVPQNHEKAAKWLRKAAEQGHADAQVGLGVMYQYGEGVVQDYAKALKWYRKAANQGQVKAQVNLGNIYGNGDGVPVDYAEAARWYRKAAAQGDAIARHNLGQIYYFGTGVTQDYSEAFRWYRKAAEQGNALGAAWAQYDLGIMYGNGEGVPQNFVKAHMWFDIAIKNGDEESSEAQERVAEKLTLKEIFKSKTMAHECINSNYRNCAW